MMFYPFHQVKDNILIGSENDASEMNESCVSSNCRMYFFDIFLLLLSILPLLSDVSLFCRCFLLPRPHGSSQLDISAQCNMEDHPRTFPEITFPLELAPLDIRHLIFRFAMTSEQGQFTFSDQTNSFTPNVATSLLRAKYVCPPCLSSVKTTNVNSY